MLNIYMGYSRSAGKEEGAVLVFAHTAKEAKKLTFNDGLVVDEWIDTAVKRLKNKPWLYNETRQEILGEDIPHVVESPTVCKICGQWGDEIQEDGSCSECGLIRIIRGY